MKQIQTKKSTIKLRIIEKLESGPKRYMELLNNEYDSPIAMKQHLQRKINELSGILDRNDFDREEDKLEIDELNKSRSLVKFAYEQFIKEVEDNQSMIELRNKLRTGNSRMDFSRGAIHLSFGSYLRKLVEEGKIIRIKRGLYQLK